MVGLDAGHAGISLAHPVRFSRYSNPNPFRRGLLSSESVTCVEKTSRTSPTRLAMLQRLLGISTTRPLRWRKAALGHSWHRFMRHQAFDDAFDAEELLEARRWHQSFQPSSIPKGQTVFSRSSGPGGQHVNKYGW